MENVKIYNAFSIITEACDMMGCDDSVSNAIKGLEPILEDTIKFLLQHHEMKNGEKPKFLNCVILYDDDTELREEKIALFSGKGAGEGTNETLNESGYTDEDIFFYIGGEDKAKEIVRLIKPNNGEDFVIISITGLE